MRKFYIKAEIKKTKNRNLKILPSHISKTIQVYNGKTFVNVFVKKEMVGYKLGEFSKTRKAFKFKKAK